MKISELKDLVTKVVKEMSMVSGGTAQGATVTGGPEGEQTFTPVTVKKPKKAKKVKQEVKQPAVKLTTAERLVLQAKKDGYYIPGDYSQALMDKAKEVANEYDKLTPEEQKVRRDEYYGLFIQAAKLKKADVQEDAPMLAHGKVKNNYAVSHFGYTPAPSVPNRKSKAMDYKQLFEDEENLEVDDRVKVVYGNEFYGETGTITDIKRGFVTVEMDSDGNEYSMHLSDVEKIEDEDEDDDMSSRAYIPDNIRKFAQRKGISDTVSQVAQWAEKAGKRIVGGTAIGKDYSTLILDLTYQGGEIRIDTDTERIEINDQDVIDYESFADALDSLSEAVNEIDTNNSSTDEILTYLQAAKQQGKLSPDAQQVLLQWMNSPGASREEIIRVLKQLTGVHLNENYSQFRNKTSKRDAPEQLHKAIKEIKKKLQEVDKLVEYTNRLRTEISEGEGEVKYNTHTTRALEQIQEMIKHTYIKAKKLK